MTLRTRYTQVGRTVQMALGALAIGGALLAVPSGEAYAATPPCNLQALSPQAAAVNADVCDLAQALLPLQIDRANVLTNTVQSIATEMQQRNIQILVLNQTIAQKRMFWQPYDAERVQLDALMAQSQLDVVRMNNMVNKNRQALELMTNTLQKLNDLANSIIRNIG